MNIFQTVKENVTARQAAEQYGLKINRNGMICCPFHDDRHPSMKVDKELNKSLKLVEACKTEYRTFSRFDYTDIEDEIRHSIEVPNYPYAEKKQVDYYDDYEPVTDTVDNAAVSEVQMEIDTDKKKDVSLDVEEISNVVVEEDIIAVEYGVADVEAIAPGSVEIEEIFSIDQINYEDSRAYIQNG